jgi:LPPG:FO 2-phospho-L-lactate transferase
MIVALAGGVGGAKLADGLYAELPANSLTVVVNTADDFTLHGLHISPDLDTVMYTLAGVANPETGWGVDKDTFSGLDMLGRYGAPDWFRLGDRDLVTQILRTTALREGSSLTEVTARLGQALGIQAALLPMCDEQVQTIVQTPDGELGFQEYFVHRQCRDHVLGVHFEGLEQASLSDAVRSAISQCEAVIICPSNPIVSVGPILGVPGLRECLLNARVPVIAVSPIIAGQAVKGPAARMLEGLGKQVSVVGVAAEYKELAPVLVIDEDDRDLAGEVAAAGSTPVVAPILMKTPEDRRSLARRVLDIVREVRINNGMSVEDQDSRAEMHA